MALEEIDINVDSLSASSISSTTISVGIINATTINVSGSSSINTNDNRLYSQNIINVKKNPGIGEFLTIEDALNSITANTDSNRYIIKGGVGRFFENKLNWKPYVSFIGSSIQETIVEPIGSHDLFVFNNIVSEISFLTIQNVQPGYSGVFCNNAGDYTQLHKVSFVDCDTSIKVIATSQDTSCYLEYVDINGIMTYGLYIDGSNGFYTNVNSENFYTFPSTTGATGIYMTGNKSNLYLYSYGLFGNFSPSESIVTNNIGFHIQDGAHAETHAGIFSLWDKAIYNPNTGAAIAIDLEAANMENNNMDIILEHPSSAGAFIGSGNLSKINIPSTSQFSTSFVQPHAGGGLVITGDIYNGKQILDIAEITTLIKNQDVGLISGGQLTIGTGLTVNISSGVGYLVDTGVMKKYSWPNTGTTISSGSTEYVYINTSGVITKSTSIPDKLSNIILGRVNATSKISFIDAISINANYTGNKIVEMLREVFGAMYYQGSIVSEDATPFKLNVTAGEYYFGSLEFAPNGSPSTPLVFDLYHRDGSSGWITTTGNTIPNTQYDNGTGTLTAITSGYYTKGTLYVCGDGVNEKWMYIYPQNQYSTSGTTESAPLSTPPTFFTNGVVKVASVIIKQGSTNIFQILSERPFPTVQTSASAPVTSHLALTDLVAGNAGHSQFMMLNGSTPMIGNLNLNANNLISGGTINGVTIESHESRHLPNGADPLITGVPSSIGNVNTEGIQNAFSRQDHIHAHGTISGGTTHSVVDSTHAGYMSSVDKVYLDTIPSLLITKANLSGATFSNLSSSTLSGGTLYSGSTNIYSIFTTAFGNTGYVQYKGNNGLLTGSTNFTWNDALQFLNIGPSGSTLLNNPLSVNGNVNSYAQMNVQNINSGTSASSDIIATADNGNDSSFYVNLGINSSGYNDTGFTVNQANDSYLYASGGDIAIGTDTIGKNVLIFGGGTLAANEIARFNQIDSSLIVRGPITATTVSATTIYLKDSSVPTIPVSGVSIFSENVANRKMTAQVGPSGIDYCFQPGLSGNKVAWWNPPGNSTTAPGLLGMAALTATGTATARNVATTNLFARTRRLATVSNAGVGSLCGFRGAALQYTLGAGSGVGGFMYVVRFGVSDANTATRMFVGLRNVTTAPTNVEPSGLTNSIGIGNGAADSTLHIYYGGSVAQTPIDLGVNFPCNTNSVDLYELALFATPNSGNTIGYRVVRLNTGNVSSGILVGTAGTALPSNTTLLVNNDYRTNNGTAGAVGLDYVSIYFETDY